MTDENDGMTLTPDESKALALRLVARFISSDQEWIEWEDLPNLGEFVWYRLVDDLNAVGASLVREANERDAMTGIDTHELIERATAMIPAGSDHG